MTIEQTLQQVLERLQKLEETVERQTIEQNNRLQKLEEIVDELTCKRHEIYYQRKLETLLGGSHFNTPEGQIDILTSTTLYEIKIWKDFKHAYGQLLSYAKYVPGKQRALIFFGKCRMKQALKKQYLEDKKNENIDIYQVHDTPDGNVSLELLNGSSSDENAFVIKNKRDVCKVMSKFVNEKCDVNRDNKSYKVFATELWNAFNDWQTDKDVTPLVKHNDFYKEITQLVDYHFQRKVRINSQNSTGWCGIRLKDADE